MHGGVQDRTTCPADLPRIGLVAIAEGQDAAPRLFFANDDGGPKVLARKMTRVGDTVQGLRTAQALHLQNYLRLLGRKGSRKGNDETRRFTVTRTA